MPQRQDQAHRWPYNLGGRELSQITRGDGSLQLALHGFPAAVVVDDKLDTIRQAARHTPSVSHTRDSTLRAVEYTQRDVSLQECRWLRRP